jgi:hypothetical protein
MRWHDVNNTSAATTAAATSKTTTTKGTTAPQTQQQQQQQQPPVTSSSDKVNNGLLGRPQQHLSLQALLQAYSHRDIPPVLQQLIQQQQVYNLFLRLFASFLIYSNMQFDAV